MNLIHSIEELKYDCKMPEELIGYIEKVAKWDMHIGEHRNVKPMAKYNYWKRIKKM
jgi:hypothetical protein